MSKPPAKDWIERSVEQYADLLQSPSDVGTLESYGPDHSEVFSLQFQGEKKMRTVRTVPVLKKSSSAPSTPRNTPEKQTRISQTTPRPPLSNVENSSFDEVFHFIMTFFWKFVKSPWSTLFPRYPGLKNAIASIWPVILFALLDSSKSLIVNWAQPQVRSAVLVTVKSLFSTVIGLTVAYFLRKDGGWKECLSARRIWMFLPVASAFALSQIFSVMALKHLDAGVQKVLSQMSIPTIAFLSRIILGRQYSWYQWQNMVMLFCCTTAYVELNIREQGILMETTKTGAFLGFLYVFLSIALSSFASVLAEWSLKKSTMPFYIQKTNLMMGEFLVAFVASFTIPFDLLEFEDAKTREGVFLNLYYHWNWKTSVMMLDWLVHGWFAGLIAKRFSALIKRVSQTSTVLVTFSVSTILQNSDNFWITSIIAWLIVLTVVAFSFAAYPQPTAEARMSALKDVELTNEAFEVGRYSEVSRVIARKEIRYSGKKKRTIILLVACFGILDSLKSVMIHWCYSEADFGASTQKPPKPPNVWWSFLWLQSVVSFSLAMAISYVRGGTKEIRRCCNYKVVAGRFPLAICLVISKLFYVMALSQLDAATVRITSHLGMPCVAIISALLLRTRFSVAQWISVVQIALSSVAFYELHLSILQERSPWRMASHKIDFIGASYLFISLAVNSCGSIFGEYYLKKRYMPFYEQKAHLLVCQLILTTVGQGVLLLLGEPLFANWNFKVFLTCVVWVLAGWFTSMIVKLQSALGKQIAQSMAAILTFTFTINSNHFKGENTNYTMLSLVLIALFAILAVFSFFMATEKIKKSANEVRVAQPVND